MYESEGRCTASRDRNSKKFQRGVAEGWGWGGGVAVGWGGVGGGVMRVAREECKKINNEIGVEGHFCRAAMPRGHSKSTEGAVDERRGLLERTAGTGRWRREGGGLVVRGRGERG